MHYKCIIIHSARPPQSAAQRVSIISYTGNFVKRFLLVKMHKFFSYNFQ